MTKINGDHFCIGSIATTRFVLSLMNNKQLISSVDVVVSVITVETFSVGFYACTALQMIPTGNYPQTANDPQNGPQMINEVNRK